MQYDQGQENLHRLLLGDRELAPRPGDSWTPHRFLPWVLMESWYSLLFFPSICNPIYLHV